MASIESVVLLTIFTFSLLASCGLSQRIGVHSTSTNKAISSNQPVNKRPAANAPCRRHSAIINKNQQTLPHSWKPSCDESGFFAPKQCNYKYCWCSDLIGNMISGTLKPLKNNIECSLESLDKPCQIAYAKVMASANIPDFVPRCAKDGHFLPRQCSYKHTTLCWCVDNHGTVIPGTRKIGLMSCEARNRSHVLSGPAKRPLCLIERRHAIGISLSRKPFVPQCRADGSFVPIQCNVYKGYCWCVNKKGKEIKGTRTKRTPNCMSKHMDKTSMKPCHLHRTYIYHLPSSSKIHIPSCKKDGFFQPVQCSRNKGVCWCVNLLGKEIDYTVTQRRLGAPNCPNGNTNLTYLAEATNPARATPCHRHREKVKKARNMNLNRVILRNIWQPSCDENGFFTATQCNSKYCWCSDRNGNMIAGTMKSSLQKSNAQCVTARRTCTEERREALLEPLSKRPFIPQCRPDGFYSPLQCNTHKGSCWCTDRNGKEIARTKTKRTPNCFSNVLNEIGQGPCTLLEAHIERMPKSSNVIEPKCDHNGFFLPGQCSRADKVRYCWCVMRDGTEIMGSLTFNHRPNCDPSDRRAPAVPKVRGPCEEHVFRLKNLVSRRNVYQPACDNNGFYLPRQCNNNTGFCWCADRYGIPQDGTKTRGTPNCGEEIVSPCIAFKKKKDGLDKAYDPVCTRNGYFAPLQCNLNSGKCWCVDKWGTGIPGTNLYARPYCSIGNRVCENRRRLLIATEQGKTTNMLPSCDAHGYYSPIQCDHVLGECLCTDKYGREIPGTRTKEMPECGQIPRPCDEHASRSSEYDFVFGVYIPQCDMDGYYKVLQCHKITNTCWCSNKIGVEIPGTKTTGEAKCNV